MSFFIALQRLARIFSFFSNLGLSYSLVLYKNRKKNPKVWLPPIIASAITGPLATCLFKMEMNGAAVSSGMGTCGLVGQIGVITGWFEPSEVAIGHGAVAITPGFMDWLGFVLPAVLTWAFGLLFRKIGWIKEGDLSLEEKAPVKPVVEGDSETSSECR